MTIERKVGMGIAGQPSGATDVADVFSTYLYTGTGSTAQTINNGIDLDGEGGMTWIKSRSHAYDHVIQDSESGITKSTFTNTNDAADAAAPYMTSYNSNGFTVAGGGWYATNETAYEYASWTFRKKKKFFDVVTWTGNGVAGRTVAHGLNGPIGMLVVKRTDSSDGWYLYHKGLSSNAYGRYLTLNSTDAEAGDGSTNYWSPTDSSFGVNYFGNNVNGATYVAYLFADNSSEDAEEQMIKCGSYTGNGSLDGPEINLGWEPQWIIIKRTTYGAPWLMYDSMRGIDALITADHNGAENSIGGVMDWVDLQATGFKIKAAGGYINENTNNYIYMAIRAPMMVEPEAATDVFAIDRPSSSGTLTVESGFPIDLVMVKSTSGGANYTGTRLTGKTLYPHTQGAEWDVGYSFDFNDKATIAGSGDYSTWISWMWKRAKGYFDVVAYSGNATSGRAVPHSLGVAPEMMWVKSRTASNQSWRVYHASLGATHGLNLDSNSAAFALTRLWNDTAPTNSSFIVGNHGSTNDSSHIYIAYLFATLPGISKVGSFVGNGTTQTIDCGFSAGARFLLIKGSTNTQNWYVFDSLRGIVARPAGQPFSPYAYGLDAKLQLDNTSAQFINVDFIDPHNSGFIVNAGAEVNGSGVTYIFYAIA